MHPSDGEVVRGEPGGRERGEGREGRSVILNVNLTRPQTGDLKNPTPLSCFRLVLLY